MSKSLLEPAVTFLSAFLLFQVQPLMGRYILPWFGGSPSVWTACMLFFQVLLLAGYAYAHWLSSAWNGRRQGLAHAALLIASLLLLPVDAHLAKPGSLHLPTIHVLQLLALSVGLPFFLLSATGPLVQRWSRLESPYRLYAFSNAGSFLGLLAYPFVVEPALALHSQAILWSAAYAAFVAGFGWISVSAAPAASRSAAVPVALRTWIGWMLLSACASALLVATTNQMSQEIAVSPFLWVLPLAVYLLTFVIVFGRPDAYRAPQSRQRYGAAAAILIPAACILVALGLRAPLWAHLLVYPSALFAGAMICHGELGLSKPPAQQLTSFYLALSAGGALGGAAVAVLAPAAFNDYDEYPLMLAAVALLLFRKTSGLISRALLLAALVAVVALGPAGGGTTIAKWRNFFGILRVSEQDGKRLMSHGRVTHGFQFLDPEKAKWPTAYYGSESGVGLAIERHPARGVRPLRIGVVGLGVGAVASYGRPGDVIRFYEINPDVERLSREYFTYRKDSAAAVDVVLDDARLALEREPSGQFDILAIDAFSSDAVPAHLLTAEAAQVYRRHLAPGGVLLFHITNQYVDLAPLARGIAGRFGWDAVRVVAKANEERGVSASVWVLIAEPAPWIQALPVSPWTSADRSPSLWTDDHTSPLRLLR